MSKGDVDAAVRNSAGVVESRALSPPRAKGVTTILNLAPLIADAGRLGRLADIVIANETEFELRPGRKT